MFISLCFIYTYKTISFKSSPLLCRKKGYCMLAINGSFVSTNYF